MATVPVKFFKSTMQGAPQLSAAWGAMTALLDAVLVNGFNLKPVTTLTSSAGVATVTIAGGHGYWVDQVIAVAGADQAAYNGEFRVLSITTTTLTYALEGTPVSPATGAAITVKTAPLGWEIAFTGASKRAYRSLNLQSNKPYLRVDDGLDPVWNTAYAKYAKVTMAEGMSDIDTFVGYRAPYDPLATTKNEVGTGSGATAINGWYKWYYARYTASNTGITDSTGVAAGDREWVIVGDDRGFYLFNHQSLHQYDGRSGYCFTDFESFRQADGYNTLLCATDRYVTANSAHGSYSSSIVETGNWFPWSMNFSGKVLMTDHTQVGANQRVGFVSLNTDNGALLSGLSGNIPYPNPSDYGLIIHPIYLNQESSKGFRGKLPGVYWVHGNNALLEGDVVEGVVGYPDRKFRMVRLAYNGADYAGAIVAMDITGPWW
jgi:hypothetical protein